MSSEFYKKNITNGRAGAVLSLCFFLFIAAGCASAPRSPARCLENRAALDIGSGSTKILIAKVNTCIQKIEAVLFQDAKSIKVKESIKNNQNQIPQNVLADAINTLNTWKSDHKRLNIKNFEAVATEVFRDAKNGSNFIAELSKQTAIPIKVIDQSEEAKLGFWAAIAASDRSVHEIVVWDIGGGSMQMTSYNADGTYNMYKGKMASVSFKDSLLKAKPDSSGHDLKTNSKLRSPNPLGKALAKKAVHRSSRFSQQKVPQKMKDELSKKQVVGIGGVHAKSVLRQVQGDAQDPKLSYAIADLKKTLTAKIQLSDDQLGGSYPETDVTNLALVLGFMQGLKIPQVDVISADLTYGILLLSLSKKNSASQNLK